MWFPHEWHHFIAFARERTSLTLRISELPFMLRNFPVFTKFPTVLLILLFKLILILRSCLQSCCVEFVQQQTLGLDAVTKKTNYLEWGDKGSELKVCRIWTCAQIKDGTLTSTLGPGLAPPAAAQADHWDCTLSSFSSKTTIGLLMLCDIALERVVCHLRFDSPTTSWFWNRLV